VSDKKLNKNQIIESEVVDFCMDGGGIIKVGTVPIFVPQAIVGEKVKVKILAVKKSLCYGKLEKILTPSPNRIKPKCVYFSKCGGCDLQHINYETQLKFKENLIKNTFKKIAGLEVSVNVVGGNPYHYRNKLSLPVRQGKDGKTEIGFFRKNSHDVIDVSECLIQKHSIKELIASCKKYMSDNDIKAYCEKTHSGDIRHISLRQLGSQTIVTLVGLNKNLNRFKDFAQSLKTLYGDGFALYYNCNPVKTNVIYGEEFVLLGGNLNEIDYMGLKIKVHPASFFQVNDEITQKLYSHIIEHIKSLNISSAVEAYSGQGILASKLSEFLDKVYAIEINESSIADGENNKIRNKITNLEFIQGDCADKLKRYEKGDCPLFRTAMILDPPRSGLDDRVIDTILNSNIQDVVYVSCSPQTLARDIKKLSNQYNIKNITVFDMFANTKNCETVVFLSHKKK